MAGYYGCKSTYKNGIHNYLEMNKIEVKNAFKFCVEFLETIYPNLHDKKLDWIRVGELVQNNFPKFKEYVKNVKNNYTEQKK